VPENACDDAIYPEREVPGDIGYRLAPAELTFLSVQQNRPRAQFPDGHLKRHASAQRGLLEDKCDISSGQGLADVGPLHSGGRKKICKFLNRQLGHCEKV